MPQVIFSQAALQDLERLHQFLLPKNRSAARRAAQTIIQGCRAFGAHPQIGRLIDELPEQYREWLIEFGDSGYLARYHMDDVTVTILAIRHQKEAGYK